MGKKMAKIVVHVTLSNHNSEQDDADDQTLDALAEHIRGIAASTEYDPIRPDVEVDYG